MISTQLVQILPSLFTTSLFYQIQPELVFREESDQLDDKFNKIDYPDATINQTF